MDNQFNCEPLPSFNGVYDSATKAWDAMFNALVAQKGGDTYVRGRKMHAELLNAQATVLDIRKNFVHSKIRKLPMQYAIGELLWYLSHSDSLDGISQYSDAWNKLSDDGETLNSSYGARIHWKNSAQMDQWEYVKGLLLKDLHTRQAVIHIKEPSPKQSKDVPCTLTLQFQYRHEALHCTAVMRSNDIWLGTPYDMFAFMSLQALMCMELDVPLGMYTHFAANLHLYEDDFVKWFKEASDNDTTLF